MVFILGIRVCPLVSRLFNYDNIRIYHKDTKRKKLVKRNLVTFIFVMKKLLKLISQVLRINHLLVLRSNRALICGFHRIVVSDGSMLDQRIERLIPKDFEHILLYLRSLGYSFVSLDNLINAPDLTRKAVITFDDGFRSVYTHAFPILRKHAVPFTVFLTSSTVDSKRLLWPHRIYTAIDRLAPAVVLQAMEDCSILNAKNSSISHAIDNAIYYSPPNSLIRLANRLAHMAGLTPNDEIQIADRLYLKINDIRDMMRNGMSIGAHGHEHWCLTTLGEQQTSMEIGTCADFITNKFGTSPEFYSLAYGEKNRWVDSLAQQRGFMVVCTTNANLVRQDHNPYTLPRLMVGNDPLNFKTAFTKLHFRIPQSSQIIGEPWDFMNKRDVASNNFFVKLNATDENRNGWVSVVLPTYNRKDLVIVALESIFRQSFRPIEVLVVDDGSTDNTIDIIREWVNTTETPDNFVVQCVRQDNKGANAARNRGILHSTGEFIAFLDSDDQWVSSKLEKQMNVFRSNPEVSAVYCGLRYLNVENGQHLPDSPRQYPIGRILKDILVHDVTEGTPCWVVRKRCFEHVGLFDEGLPARQDWDMSIRLAAAYTIGCVSEVLVEAGEHPGERVRSNPMKEIESHRRIFEKYSLLRAQFPLSVRLAARSAMYRRRGRVYFHRGISGKRAFSMYLLAILVWPFNFDSYAALIGMMLSAEFRRKIRFFWNRIFGKTKLAIKTH